VGVSQTAALNRGRHLYSAERPSRWAMANISSIKFISMKFSWVRLSHRRPHNRFGSGSLDGPPRDRQLLIDIPTFVRIRFHMIKIKIHRWRLSMKNVWRTDALERSLTLLLTPLRAVVAATMQTWANHRLRDRKVVFIMAALRSRCGHYIFVL